MKRGIVTMLVCILVSLPIMANAAEGQNNTGPVLLIAGGTGVTALGVVALLYGEKNYNDNKNDYRVTKDEADRVHKNWQTLGYVTMGVGVAAVLTGVFLYDNNPKTTVSMDVVNKTPILVATHLF